MTILRRQSGVFEGQGLFHLIERRTSWIGSVQIMLLFSVGLFSGRAFDRGYLFVPQLFHGIAYS